MATIKNNTPQTIVNGIKDGSIRELVPELDQVPMHLPYIIGLGEKGPLHPVLLGGGDLTRLYGRGTIDTRKPYMNHATQMALTVLGEGNSIFFKRIVGAGAAMASVTLVAIVDRTLGIIKDYAREGGGAVILDVNGDPTFELTDVLNGASIKYTWVDTTSFAGDFSSVVAGNVTTYPLLTVDASHIGMYGNNIGIKLWQAAVNTVNPADQNVVDLHSTLIYNAQLIERNDNNTAVIIDDLYSSNIVEFSFKPDVYDPATNVDLTIDALVNNYTNDGKATRSSPIYGPLGAVKVHPALVELIDALVAVENVLAPAPTTNYMLDIFGGVDTEGDHHYAFQIDNTGDKLSSNRVQYLIGGSDGDTSLANFDAMVGTEFDGNLENPDYPLVDDAKYPFSVVYDSGFSVPVKKKLLQILPKRPEVYVSLATHVAGADPLTVSEEISVATDLRSTAAAYAESSVHGTGTVRVTINPQSGKLITSNYKETISLIFDIAKKRARFMGAGNGKMKPGLGYDNFPLNVVDSMKDINNTWRSSTAKESSWLAGMNYVQFMEMHTLHYPGLQTIYGIKNSVLVSEVVMMITVDVTKMSIQVWRMLSGNTSLTPDQFIKRSDELLLGLVANKYDGRVIVRPRTFYTPADSARGYSWTQDVVVEANVMKTVNVLNVIVNRIEEAS